MNLAAQYIDQVKSGKRLTGKWEAAAVKRHLADLKKVRRRAYPYIYNEQQAAKALGFFRLLRFTTGEWYGKPFQLQPWQAFIIAMMYGWMEKATGLRRFRKAYIRVARKNGKTELMAGVANLGMVMDDEARAQIYWGATKRDQAKIGWEAQRIMMNFLITDSKTVRKKFKTNQNRIFSPVDGSYSATLGKDSKREDGLNPHYAIIDEFHAHPDDSIVQILESGMGARRQPITWIITTAGFNREAPCHQYERVVKDVMAGKKDDDRTFGIIFALDEDDDWQDEAMWGKANPGLGVTPSLPFMRTEYTKALNEGQSKEIDFRTKNLNEWTNSPSVWIQDHLWRACGGEVDAAGLAGRKCYAGLDLAKTRDMTALVLLFPPEEDGEPFDVLCRFYCPEDNAAERTRNDQVPYMDWIREGNLIATPGNVTDYAYIEQDIMRLSSTYQFANIQYDPWNATYLATRLIEQGAPMQEMRQTVTNFNEPCNFLEKAVLQGQLRHGGDPILAWMNSNVTLYRNSTGLVKIDKEKSQEKVDGMVALAMAFAGYLNAEDEGPSVYNERGIEFF